MMAAPPVLGINSLWRLPRSSRCTGVPAAQVPWCVAARWPGVTPLAWHFTFRNGD